MKDLSLSLLFLFLLFVSAQSFFTRKFHPNPIQEGENPGKPLYLTHLIEAGKIKKAQRMAKVRPDIGNTTSYSGYLTINKTCGNNLFFWFFPAQQEWKTAPVVLWLQGGPGISFMIGLFEELGPFNSFKDGLKTREYSWNVKNNLLFIDQPVGTGYSFTTHQCYTRNMDDVGKDLYSAIIQFLKLFPILQKNKFFIAGESFAGHYIPAIGHTIHINNPAADLKVNLAGMMVGDGLTDPREQINFGDYLYETGLIDYNEREEFFHYQKLFVEQVDAGNWTDSLTSWGIILEMASNYTGLSLENYLPQPPDESNYEEFIQLSSTRKAIHVGSVNYSGEYYAVYENLLLTIPQSLKPWVEELLEEYPMVFYAGQVDIICAYPMMINFLRSMNWTGQAAYLNATRSQWKEGDDIAGYVKGVNNLYDVLVRDAGHMVPANQPFWAYQLLNHFVYRTGPFSGLKKITEQNLRVEALESGKK